MYGVIVEEDVQFTLVELGRACHVDAEQLTALVEEGVLTPNGGTPNTWLFDGATLRRARMALRLTQELELSPAGTAVVLDLLEEIAMLRSRLRCAMLDTEPAKFDP